MNDGALLNVLPHDAISVLFSSDNNQLISVNQEGLVRAWGTLPMTTEPIQHIGAQPRCPCFLPDRCQLAAAKGDNVYILQRDIDDVAMLNGHTGPVTSVTDTVFYCL